MATGGLYGQSSAGIVSPQSGSESSGLYGNNTVFGGTYFEWFIFQVADTQPATPTGGSWSFTTNSGTPPSGWLGSPPANPTNTVWVSVGLVNSKSSSAIEWSTPGKFSFASGLPILSGASEPTSGDGQSDQLYIQTNTAPETIWFKQAGTWTRLTGSSLYVDLTSNQTIAGTKTFSSEIQGSISGNAANVTGIVDITHGGTGSTTASAARTALGAAASGANADITSMSGVTGGITTPDYITFDVNPSTVPTAPGSLYWDSADGNQTLSLVMAGGNATQQIGEEQYYRIKASAAITEGQVVMFTGTVGASGALTGAPATGLTASTASYVMGIATQNMALNDWGYVTSFGLVRNINTNAWAAGTILYYDPTVAGGLTSTLPSAPNAKVQVCAVIYQSASNGSLFVRPSFGGILGQYEGDVGFTSTTAGDVIVRNSGNTAWENKAQSTLIAGNVSGTVAIANGGTGQTTANAAFNALAPSQTGNSGKYLTTDGSNTSWATNPLGTVTSVDASGGTTGLTFSGGPITTSGTLTLAGTLGTANGGTNLTSFTANGVMYASSTSALATGSVLTFDGAQLGVNGITIGRGAGAVSTNTAVGASALAANTTGASTTALGYLSLNANTSGTSNTGLGRGALYVNTTGSYNVAVGERALVSNTTASNNTAVGYQAGYSNVDGNNNVAVGRQALYSNTSANYNTAVGYQSLYANTTATYNSALGYLSLNANTTGANNTAFGGSALASNTTASNNTAVGYRSLYLNTTGTFNTAIGRTSLESNTTGNYNNAFGSSDGSQGAALASNTTASYNNAFGNGALALNTTGANNSAFGHQALGSNTTASNNVAVGYLAGYSNTTGGTNVYVGRRAGYTNTVSDNNTFVGDYSGNANTGARNTGLGSASLQNNSSGNYNVAVGYTALYNNTTASNNTAVGYQAGYSNTTGGGGLTVFGSGAGYAYNSASEIYGSTFIGLSSGLNASTGHDNTFIGGYAGRYITSGNYNVAVGGTALYGANGTSTGNYNVAVGYSALGSNTSASYNTAVGYQSLYTNTTGDTNTGTGYQSLFSNTTGSSNTAYGLQSMRYNTTGGANAAFGREALVSNTTGNNNAAVGQAALYNNTTASGNVAVGFQAAYLNNTGGSLTAIGYQAGYNTVTFGTSTFVGSQAGLSNTTGYYLTAIGNDALKANTTGLNNTALGFQSLYSNTTASNNTAVGYQALYSNTTSGANTAVGYNAGQANTTGAGNTFIGYLAGLNFVPAVSGRTNGNIFIGMQAGSQSNNVPSGDANTIIGSNCSVITNAAGGLLTTGSANTFIGGGAGYGNTTGGYNTYVGINAGTSMTTGSKNTIIGAYSGNSGGLNITTASNYIVLSDGDGNPRGWFDGSGNFVLGSPSVNFTGSGLTLSSNSGTTKWLVGPYNAAATNFYICSSGSTGVYLNGTSATSWSSNSDFNLKTDLVAIANAAEKVASLRAVTGRYKTDPEGTSRAFLIAQDVQSVLPEAVSPTTMHDGTEVLGLAYTEVIPLLVAAIKELKAEIDLLKGN